MGSSSTILSTMPSSNYNFKAPDRKARRIKSTEVFVMNPVTTYYIVLKGTKRGHLIYNGRGGFAIVKTQAKGYPGSDAAEADAVAIAAANDHLFGRLEVVSGHKITDKAQLKLKLVDLVDAMLDAGFRLHSLG